MSHFAVLVIGDDVEAKLKPFDENLEVPRYVLYTKEELIQKRKKDIESFKNSTYKEFINNPEEYIKNCSNPKHIQYIQFDFPKKIFWSDEEIYQDAIKYEEPENIGENGEIYSVNNPQGHWDWYSIGGRYSNFFLLKGNEHKTGDQALKKDIDLRCVGWKSLTDEELRQEFYDLSLGKHKDQWYTPEYYIQRYKNAENYIRLRRALNTYAVIDSEGVWHSPGEMGWFGMSTESAEEMYEWQEKYYDRFLKDLPDDTLLTIVDCHT